MAGETDNADARPPHPARPESGHDGGEPQFAGLVAAMAAGICTVDAAGRLTYFNPRAAEIWCVTPLLGASDAEFARTLGIIGPHGRPVPLYERPLAVALKTGRSFHRQEVTMERPDGSRFQASVSIDPLRGADGGVAGAIAVFTDQTARNQAQAMLRHTEERYRAVFQQAAVGIFECDMEGRIVRTNAALQRLAGYTDAELRGMNWRQLVPPDQLGSATSLADTLRRGEIESFSAERRFIRRDGAAGWVDVFATIIHTSGDQPSHGLVVVVDITQRKRAETATNESRNAERARRQELEALNQVAPAAIWIAHDRECRDVTRNAAALTLLRIAGGAEGPGADPLVDVGQARVFRNGAPVPETELPLRRAARTGESVLNQELEFRAADGSARWVYGSATPLRDEQGAIRGAICVLVDITSRRQTEAALRASEEQLRLVTERARDEAVAASHAKDDFLAALSHELRTPLSPVLLLASEGATDASLPATARATFEMIRKSVEIEARLIDDLLDLTRIVRNKLVLDQRPVDVPLVLGDALVTVRAELTAKGIALVLDLAPGPQLVLGDPVRLQQAFWNVLKNATKFTPENGRITIASRVGDDGRRVVVEVTDTGIGLTPEEIEQVFEAFAQGEHARPGGSHRFGGLGLGLAISRRLVELHGGTITAESRGRHHGASFRIELPRLPPSAARSVTDVPSGLPATAPVATAAAPGARILLVEDHAPTRTALNSLLARRRYEVGSAGTAAEARILAAHQRYDVLISDIGLPDGSGHELMQEFKVRYGMRGIALTGYGTEEDVKRSRDAGFLFHLTKPIRVQHLDEALTSLGGPAPEAG